MSVVEIHPNEVLSIIQDKYHYSNYVLFITNDEKVRRVDNVTDFINSLYAPKITEMYEALDTGYVKSHLERIGNILTLSPNNRIIKYKDEKDQKEYKCIYFGSIKHTLLIYMTLKDKLTNHILTHSSVCI